MRPTGNLVPVIIILSLLAAGHASADGDAPVACAGLLDDPTDLWTGFPVHFTSNGSHAAVGPVNLTWDFGDGTESSSLADPVHTYEEPGTYNVTLTVVDRDNQIARDTIALEVRPDYGDTGIVIKAVDPRSTWEFFDPQRGEVSQVAVKGHGWVAYLCELRAGQEITVRFTVIGDHPADLLLLRAADFAAYGNGSMPDAVPTIEVGSQQAVLGQFRYRFKAPGDDRYYIVIDNQDWPEGTPTEGPVDYTISVEPEVPSTEYDPRTVWVPMAVSFLAVFLIILALIGVVMAMRRTNEV